MSLLSALRPSSWLRREVGAPPHVCHLVETLEPGGVSHRVMQVSSALLPGEFMVSCLALGARGPLAFRLEPKVQVFSLEHSRGRAELARALRRYRVDLLHTHCWRSYGVGVAAAALARVAHVVHSVHDGEGQALPSSTVLRLARLRTRRYAVQSHAAVREAAELLGVRASSIAVLPTGVSTQRCRADLDHEAARAALDIRPGQTAIGAVGRLDGSRKHAQLLEACALLVGEGVDLRCLLVGDGPDREVLRLRARQLGLGDRASFFGHVPDVTSPLAAMDIFVHLSTSTGVSVSLLEAMACALPVVATNEGAAPEVIRDGESGLLVPADRPQILARILRQLADNPERRAALGARARQCVEREHTLGVMAEGYATLYREVLAG
jgi:glycosyltransferase involved in cell wall biosynthesis